MVLRQGVSACHLKTLSQKLLTSRKRRGPSKVLRRIGAIEFIWPRYYYVYHCIQSTFQWPPIEKLLVFKSAQNKRLFTGKDAVWMDAH
uniref:Transposase n=1 Tax=Steinernema glaseri TaxID=37863 RepID=A0A1I8APB5_9BILA